MFFIGNTLQFGWWIVFPILTIWGGGFITKYFTRTLVSRRHIAKRFAAVLLTLVLDGTNESIRSASIVRVVALTNILAILWLEFSAFADVSSKLIISESILWGAMFLYGCAFAVLYFTLRFGLRGSSRNDGQRALGERISLGSLGLCIEEDGEVVKHVGYIMRVAISVCRSFNSRAFLSYSSCVIHQKPLRKRIVRSMDSRADHYRPK